MRKLDLEIIPDNKQAAKAEARSDGCGCKTTPGLRLSTGAGGTLPPWADGIIETPGLPKQKVFRISGNLSLEDRIGEVRSRISAFRNSYSVPPGLYAMGNPGPESDVFASANYKLSFDKLRKALGGTDSWVLVLDTGGINVWCAAGKGSFGTDELVNRIRLAGLERLVSHRRIIVPQLGAPGVNAALVKENTGFRVSYGPVRASDIPAYVAAGYRASRDMRTIKFPLMDRLVLTPMEINPSMKYYPAFALIVLAVFGLEPEGIIFREAWRGGYPYLVMGLLSVFAGAFLTPVFLPFVPFRSFAIKGWIVGLIVQAIYLTTAPLSNISILPVFHALVWVFFPLLSSFIALQFTGSTVFTGMSGVKKELRYGMPIYISGAVLSAGLIIIGKLNGWGLI